MAGVACPVCGSVWPGIWISTRLPTGTPTRPANGLPAATGSCSGPCPGVPAGSSGRRPRVAAGFVGEAHRGVLHEHLTRLDRRPGALRENRDAGLRRLRRAWRDGDRRGGTGRAAHLRARLRERLRDRVGLAAGVRTDRIDDVDDEHQGVVTRDIDSGVALRPVAVRGRQAQQHAAAHWHPDQADVPAGHDGADADLERARRAPVVGVVEDVAAPLLPQVVGDQPVARLRERARALGRGSPAAGSAAAASTGT